ncbi:MAG: hypothetical protein MUC49_22805 [Raineya sp.]|nr:hypothetical protein [Raineya sp.]
MSVYIKLNKKKNAHKNEERATGFETPRSDLSKYNYTRSWEQQLSENVYGYEVPVPDMPPEEEIINYGLPLEEQIFRKTALPKNFSKLSLEEQEVFISKEHHRRKHGLWFFIKGKPVYITGLFYYFMNYWPLATGKPTRFHFGDWKFFMIWQLVVMDPTVFGLIVYKCRRIGDTEKALCMVYEYATRVRNTINQMYDCRVENDMKKTWKRLRVAHKRMIWFMRPVASNDEPSDSFEFRVPKRKVDLTNSYISDTGELIFDEYEYKELDSEISYFTNSGGADGARVGRAYIDEFGKYKTINPTELWDLMKKALEDDREGEIIGKALFTSTIEDMKGGDTLETSKKFWESSDPNNVDDTGRTMTGLIRIVRGAIDRAPADRWGMVNEKEVIEKIQRRHKFLIENKKWVTLIKEKRQDCLTIEDVFSNISEGSPFNLDNISNRLNEVLYADTQRWVRGNLKWKDGKKPIAGDPNNTNRYCEVEFEPNDRTGLWYKAYDPEDFKLKSNSKSKISTKPKPGNVNYFACGIDPVSYTANLEEGDASKAGLSVKRILDHSVDLPANNYNEDGKPIDGGRWFITNRYCMHYVARHNSPSDNYNDWLMTLVYYGTDFRIEKNHSGGFMQYLETYNFMSYYEQGGTGMKNYKGKEELYGQTASNKVIEAYFGALTELTNDWCNTLDVPIALQELSTMEEKTKTKHDLGVSMGFTELHANNKIKKISDKYKYENQQEEVFEWTDEECY